MKGQVWVSDFTISLALFTIAVVAAFGLLINSFAEGDSYSRLRGDAVRISEYVMSEGVPKGFNESSYIRPGFVESGRINESQAATAMRISNSSYEAVKSSFQTRNDFAVFIEGKSGVAGYSGLCGFGRQGAPISHPNASGDCPPANFSGLQYTDLAKVTRIALLGGSLVKVTVYAWG